MAGNCLLPSRTRCRGDDPPSSYEEPWPTTALSADDLLERINMVPPERMPFVTRRGRCLPERIAPGAP